MKTTKTLLLILILTLMVPTLAFADNTNIKKYYQKEAFKAETVEELALYTNQLVMETPHYDGIINYSDDYTKGGLLIETIGENYFESLIGDFIGTADDFTMYIILSKDSTYKEFDVYPIILENESILRYKASLLSLADRMYEWVITQNPKILNLDKEFVYKVINEGVKYADLDVDKQILDNLNMFAEKTQQKKTSVKENTIKTVKTEKVAIKIYKGYR